MTNEDRERSWSTLIEKIRDKCCTPILGAGAAFPRLPLGKQLARNLLLEEEKLSGDAPLRVEERNNLTKVSQYVAVQRDNPTVKNRVVSHLQRHGKPTSPVTENPSLSEFEPHRVLASLRLPIYLTTNYDNFMFQALVEEGVSPVRAFARWNPDLFESHASIFDDPIKNYEPSPERPLVFHMHGMWDAPETMVVTEDDYLDFLVHISKDLATGPTDASKKAILPTRVRLALKKTSLLFIGYSLEDINFRVILRGLLGSLTPSGQHMNVSVQYCEGAPGKLEKYVEKYFDRSLHRLSVFWYTAPDFCRELNGRLHPAARPATAS